MDFGRLSELRKVAAFMDLDVDIVHAMRPNSPAGVPASYFVVAEGGVLLDCPEEIGKDFDEAHATLLSMKAQSSIYGLRCGI
jgi:hypothetical protein